jgi:hypothetical protein
MPKIPLTIETNYRPNWGLWHGVRELVQNAVDAETQYKAPMDISFSNNTLRIENDGVTLPQEALLLGHTSKTGEGLRGKWGDGLKIGLLALVRAGYKVKIRSGSEVWTPAIERHAQFKADVLTINIETGRQDKNRVRIEIEGISLEEWQEMRENFLFLTLRENQDRVKTSEGTLLLSPKYKGKLYVKGIFVQNHTQLSFGYDIEDADLDIDRKMIESWSLSSKTRRIYLEAMASRSDLFAQFDKQLASGSSVEVQNLSDYNVDEVPEEAVAFVANKFRERHGDNAVPVRTLGESKDLDHLGAKGVVVNEQQLLVLSQVLDTADKVTARLREEVVKRFGWHDLSTEEQDALTEAVATVNAVEPVGFDTVEVVTFRSKDLLGQYKDGKTLLSRKILADYGETLATIVHEVAHARGGDGDKSHVAQIERIWKEIAMNYRAKR